jgi:hypothetical protein
VALTVTAPAGEAASHPRVRTNRGCYLVGQEVVVTGSGFAPARVFDVAIDGVDFGQSVTSDIGTFTAPLVPGGLPAGQPQHVDQLDASDGTTDARAAFTITRPPGFRILATSGNPQTLSAPLELWGYSMTGARKPVYLHYLAPSGSARSTSTLGRTTGQCGYLRTRNRPLFPFSPSAGTWTLQLDTHAGYGRRPSGPVARIRVSVR